VIRLVTRGDDAGSSKSANRAIHAAAKKGILRNASVLAAGPSVVHAAKVLGGLAKSGELCIGLHATVTCEWEWPVWGPVLDAERVSSLVDERGALHRKPGALLEYGAAPGEVRDEVHAEVRDQVLAEVAAQLGRLRSLGLEVSYIDEHMCFGRLGGVGEGLAELAKREGLVYDPPVEGLARPGPGPDEHDHASRLLAALEGAGPGTYLVVGHPTFDDDEMARCHGAGTAEGEVGPDRNGQRLMFMREDVVAWCRSNDVSLLRYDEL
jgi:predicted glycoside hydrolase/deacetylase ChbG (UPF0249 family)